jgi:hypothetical protein
MSDSDRQAANAERNPEAEAEGAPSQGPNLVLLYSLIALALAAAIGFALMIVMPFHHRR